MEENKKSAHKIFDSKSLNNNFSREDNTPIPLRVHHENKNIFPLSALGSDLEELIYTVSDINAVPYAMATQSLLSSLALISQAHVDVIMDGRCSPSSLFLLTVGESGSRKSTIDKIMTFPVKEFEHQKANAYKKDLEIYTSRLGSVGKNDPQPIKPREPFLLQGEPTYEGLFKSLEKGQPYMGIFSDEGGRFIGGHAMNQENRLKTIAGFSEIWDGSSITRSRASEGQTKLYGRRLSFHLMMQPRIAAKLFSDNDLLDQGFLARCLIYSSIGEFKEKPYQENNILNLKCYQKYINRMNELMHMALTVNKENFEELEPQKILVPSDGKSLLINFYNETQKEQLKDGIYSEIRPFASKALEHALRIATVLTFYKHGKREFLDSGCVRNAIFLTKFYLNEVIRLWHPEIKFKETTFTETQELASLLLDWIINYTKKNNLTDIRLREISRHAPRKIREKSIFLPLINILVEHGYLKATYYPNIWDIYRQN